MRGFTLLLGIALMIGALWGGAYGLHVLNPEPAEAGVKAVQHWATVPLILTLLVTAALGFLFVVAACNDEPWS